MATQLEIIQAFVKSLVNSRKVGPEKVETVLDTAIKSGKAFSRFQVSTKTKLSEKDSFINDLTLNGVDDFLRVYCGINFSTKDVGAISGSSAGGKNNKSAANIIAESGDINTGFTGNSFDTNNLTVELVSGKSFDDLSESERFIWQGLYTWWVKGALDLINETFAGNLDFGSKSQTNTLYVEFINDSNADKITTTYSYDEKTKKITDLTMKINMRYYNTLKDNLTEANTNFDRIVAHELTRAAMTANIDYNIYRYLPGFITEGLSELTAGLTSGAGEAEIKSLLGNTSKFEIGLDAQNLARDESFMYNGGYVFFRYLARQAGDLVISNKTTDTVIQTFYGSDTVTNTAGNVTIHSGDGADSIKSRGDNVLIESSSGSNAVYFSGAAANNTISMGSGIDKISLSAKVTDSTVFGGANNDSIYIYGTNSTISGGTGKDYISVYSDAKNNSINGDAGNDYIYIFEKASSIIADGGAGNDFIYTYENASNITLKGGAGNETIHNEGSNVIINGEEGNDYIQLHAAAKNVTVSGGAGNDSLYSGAENATVSGGDGNDYIHIYSYASKNTINAGTGDDIIESNCTIGVLYQYTSGDGNDSIKGFTKKDTLNISGSSYSTQKSGGDVIVNVGSNKITLEGAASLSDLKIGTLSGGNSTPVTKITVTDSTKSPVTVASSVVTIDAANRKTAVKITGNTLANVIAGGKGNDTLSGGKGNDSINGGAGNDSLSGGAGADTLWGGAGNDTLTGAGGNDLFIYSAGKDVITDYADGDIISLGAAISKSSVNSNDDVILTVGSGTLTIKNAKDKSLGMIDSTGSSFSTIISGNSTSKTTKLTVNDKTKSPVTVEADVRTIDASKRTTAVKITGNALANSITGGSGNDSLYGGDGNDSILGGAGNDKLFGQAGSDTLWGGAGNDTLTGGDGNDVFIYSAGKDVIADYAAGDRISLGADISKATVSGSNVVFTIGSGTLTVKDAKSKELSLINSAGESSTTIIGAAKTSTLLTVLNSTDSPVTVDATVKTIDAIKRTTAVKITGNALDNTIRGGSGNDTIYGGEGSDSLVGGSGNDIIYGENGDDTLVGGKGNDSLWGGNGADTFVYANGEGNDVIFGFEKNDLLQITGTFSATYSKSDKEVYFKVGSTSKAITLRDFTTTQFNINNTTYKISGSKLVAK